MPTSAHRGVSNSPKISVKSVQSAWADVGIGPYNAFKNRGGIFELFLVSRERSKKTEAVFLVASRRSGGKSSENKQGPLHFAAGPAWYGALQAGLQDAQDHLRVTAFLLGDLQQHTAVRSGVFGERFIRLVRGVLLGIALAERFVDAGDARRIRPARTGLFAGLEEIDRAELLRVAGLLPGHLAQHRLRFALHAAGEVRVERAVGAFIPDQLEKLFGRQRIAAALPEPVCSFIWAAGTACAFITRLQTRCVCCSVSGCMGSPSFAPSYALRGRIVRFHKNPTRKRQICTIFSQKNLVFPVCLC